MPWLSPSSSPDGSPRSKALSKFSGTTTWRSGPAQSAPSITYIPPLIDGACGTTPNSQRSIAQQLGNDITHATHLLPALARGAAAARVSIPEMVQHAGLALFEIYMLVFTIPLWLCLPGALFAVWMACCSALILGMGWSLNRRNARGGEVLRSPSPTADGWMIGQEVEDERWFFVAGMGTSSRSLISKTLPALARLFNRTIISVHAPTYGLPVDLLVAVIQRSLNIMVPSASSRALYAQIRSALLDSKTNRAVVLAHNTGAITVSQLLRQLYADVPTQKMSKLEIYTFGAAATDFTTPLGGLPCESMKTGNKKTPGQVHAPELVAEQRGPHIEHFAFESDPFAHIGVLRSVQENLEGRFCGSVFVMNCPGGAHHSRRALGRNRRPNGPEEAGDLSTEIKVSSRPLMSLSDYISCLFPDQFWPSSCTPADESQNNRSILDGLMQIDRDLAEKREFAALAKNSISHRTKGGRKRLSWTGLGATANGMNGNMDGVVGLEIARKGCKDCSGHRGREVSWLVRYLCIPSQFNIEAAPGADRVGAGQVGKSIE